MRKFGKVETVYMMTEADNVSIKVRYSYMPVIICNDKVYDTYAVEEPLFDIASKGAMQFEKVGKAYYRGYKVAHVDIDLSNLEDMIMAMIKAANCHYSYAFKIIRNFGDFEFVIENGDVKIAKFVDANGNPCYSPVKCKNIANRVHLMELYSGYGVNRLIGIWCEKDGDGERDFLVNIR